MNRKQLENLKEVLEGALKHIEKDSKKKKKDGDKNAKSISRT